MPTDPYEYTSLEDWREKVRKIPRGGTEYGP